MANADRLYWLHALTPVHVGMGRGEGYIDLPVLREKVTNYPFVPGSSMKGVFADSHAATEEARDPANQGNGYQNLLHAAFGRAGDDLANSGALVFTDARLVCLAVRSLYGTFAWCTSPLVLKRFARDLDSAGFTGWPNPPTATKDAHVPNQEADPQQIDSQLVSANGKLYLEDLDLAAKPSSTAKDWASRLARQVFADSGWHGEFTKRFVVLPDELFNFLAETGTEVQAHVRIDPDFKRVAEGALWYEESLPAESILCGFVWCDKPRGVSGVQKSSVLGLLGDAALQFGGKATTGKGRMHLRFTSSSDVKTSTPPEKSGNGGTA